MTDDNHDPFNDPERYAHPRARELMVEDFFWDCVDEEAPFGSDEGHDAYYEFRRWRSSFPGQNLERCMTWILGGHADEYNASLADHERVVRDVESPEEALLADQYDMFTLDATIIASALGQLVDEGRIDEAAKPYVRVALRRQLHPRVTTSEHRTRILQAALRVLESA